MAQQRASRGQEASGNPAGLLASFLIPAVLVAGILLLLVRLQSGAEAAVAGLSGWLPVGYAFAAGMMASVNPCGFLLLPSYISYQMGTTPGHSPGRPALNRLWRGLLVGSVATTGFVAVLAGVGGVIAAGGRWLVGVLPYAGVIIGLGMLILGIWLLLTHRTLGIAAASRVAVTPQRGLRNVFLFGASYALGSLSCTLPIFLVVVGSALASQGLWSSFVQFIGYALGMGTVLIAVTIGTALFEGTVARWLRGALPYVHRASALFLVGAGSYLVYYWLFLSGSNF